jgi:hypothetical protein
MYIDKYLKRINPYATHEVNGVVYNGNILHFPEACEALGIFEMPEPAAPPDYSEDIYYKAEQDGLPYVIYTRKPQEMINAVVARKYEQALDQHLDKVAYENGGWSSRGSLALRSGYPGPYRELAAAFGEWMDNINFNSHAYMGAVLRGEEDMPESVEAFIESLPKFNPPLVS